MRIYVDSSALIKRVIDEPESDALDEALERHVAADDVLVASSLAWVEVTRAIRATAVVVLTSVTSSRQRSPGWPNVLLQRTSLALPGGSALSHWEILMRSISLPQCSWMLI